LDLADAAEQNSNKHQNCGPYIDRNRNKHRHRRQYRHNQNKLVISPNGRYIGNCDLKVLHRSLPSDYTRNIYMRVVLLIVKRDLTHSSFIFFNTFPISGPGFIPAATKSLPFTGKTGTTHVSM
jgi:hypothetical protein